VTTPGRDPDPATFFNDMISRFRAVDHFAVGRRVLSIVALGRLSKFPIRQVLRGHVHAPDSSDDGESQLRTFLLEAAAQVEVENQNLRGVFTDVLVPDAFQTRYLNQMALLASEILTHYPTAVEPAEFGRWFSARLDQVAMAGPAATEVGTPVPLANLMVELADITPGNRILDPCCGLGGLLSQAGAKLPDLLLTGVELHPISWAFSTLRLRLLEQDARIERGDALQAIDVTPADRVLCDPPLGPYLEPAADVRLRGRRVDALFLERSFNLLASDGRAVVLVSQSTLFRRGPENDIRERLISERAIEGIIGLPPGAVSWTSAELALVVLDKSKRSDRVLMLDGAGMSASGQRGPHSLPSILESYRSQEPEPWKSWVSVEDFSKDNNLVPRRRIRRSASRPDPLSLMKRALELSEEAEAQSMSLEKLLLKVIADRGE
jgi:type I restriction-modification system DNA methylase subunit